MRNFNYFILVFFLALAGCGSEDAGSTQTKSVSVSGSKITTSVDESVLYNLSIDGLRHTVSIAENNKISMMTVSGLTHTIDISSGTSIEALTVTASNSIFTFSAGASVVYFEVTGSDNTVIVPVGSGISFVGGGLSNSLIEQ